MGNLIFWRKETDQALLDAPREGKPTFIHFFNPG